MDRTSQLGDLQIALLRALWDRGEATVAQVHDDLRQERGLAPTTIATVLTRMEKRGIVTHRNEGRQFVYRPLVSEQDIRQSMVGELTELLFEGDVAALVSHLISGREIAPGDLARVKVLIASREKELGGN